MALPNSEGLQLPRPLPSLYVTVYVTEDECIQHRQMWAVIQRDDHTLAVRPYLHYTSVVVLVLKESLRTKFKSWSWSLRL